MPMPAQLAAALHGKGKKKSPADAVKAHRLSSAAARKLAEAEAKDSKGSKKKASFAGKGK